MNKKKTFRLLSAAAILVASAVAGPLEIYLPRTVQVEGEAIQLGRVGVFSGPEELAVRAQEIPLGRFSVPGQQITLDRATIESCLAAGGFSAGQIRLSGAERVVVRRNETELSGPELLAAARSFLESQLAGQDAVIVDPQVPKGYLIGPSGSVEIIPLAGQDRIAGKRTVILSLRREGREASRIPIHFDVQFRSRQAVAVADIALGQVIRGDQIRFETVQTPEPLSVDPQKIIGMTSKRSICAGSVLHPEWLGQTVPVPLIQKRQKVFLKLEMGLMLITASGEAMDEGAAGQVIRVKRGQRPEERIVLGTVMPDGTVQPLLERGS
ncbi:MAG TPA: flagellar basal body P-ring formation chaperone FlgA [Anaerohalosphaeraceae bacterium]|jgi:flagella basal body P-ring formation protein FlgA|nr:flagellar basal body P-ring formation chaperone FlgA [Anaerohalosphaeraceae bacterium]